MSSMTDNQEDATSLTLPSPPASPKTTRPFSEIEDPDMLSDKSPASSTTTTTAPPPKKIRRQLQPSKVVQAVLLLRQERDYQRALRLLPQNETSATPAPSIAIPEPTMDDDRSGTRVRANVHQPKDCQDLNRLDENLYHQEKIRQNILHEAYLGTPTADLMLGFETQSQEAAIDRATSDAQNQDPVDRANRPRIQFSEIVQVCDYDVDEAPEISLGTTVEVSGVEMGREDKPKYHLRPRLLLRDWHWGESCPGSSIRVRQMTSLSGFHKRKRNKKMRTPSVATLENAPTHQSHECSKRIDQIYEDLKGSIVQSHKSFRSNIDRSLMGSKISIEMSHGGSKSDVQSHGDRPKGGPAFDKDLEVLFSQIRLDYGSNKETAARSNDPSNLLSFFSELSLTDQSRPCRGPSAGTRTRKVLYEPSFRIKRHYDGMRTWEFYPMGSVTNVLRLRTGVWEARKFDVLKDVYGLG
ncbi:hypothetical protein BG005_006940 [Podila minutissima]|nr:hypothetical protein BG005_006940 [Podila minutissima]